MNSLGRSNLAERERDRWRPPALEPGRTALGKLAATVRRFFDIQAGSVWNDVAATVSSVRGKVIDVGCGAQPYRSLLPDGTTYIGLDVDVAEAHFGYAVPDTIHFDGGTWPEATHGADFVMCTEALEHVLEPRALLAEAHRALRPGGQLLLTVPFAARWHFVPHESWRFTPSSLKHLLTQAGFADVVVCARGNEVTVACYKVMALLLPLLMPQGAPPAKAMALRLLGLPTVPLFVGLAGVANLSLRGRGGDDCLGYTVTATRPGPAT